MIQITDGRYRNQSTENNTKPIETRARRGIPITFSEGKDGGRPC